MKIRFQLPILIIGLFLFPSHSLGARKSVRQSQEAKPAKEFAREFYEKARNLMGQKKYHEAIESYAAAIGLNPDEPSAYVGRGDAKLELKHYREAIADYDKAIRIYAAQEAEDEKKAGGARGRGNVTLREFEAVQTGVSLQHAYNNRGFAKDLLGDKVGACKDFRESCNRGHGLGCRNLIEVCSKESVEPQTTPETTSSSIRLKLGTYTIGATLSDYSLGVRTREALTIKLRIESVDRSGAVKARLFHSIQEGQLTGRVNEEGMLELNGLTTWSTKVAASTFKRESRIKLKATVKDGKLLEGEYLMVDTNDSSEIKVVFNSFTWEENH